jgi:hypothetical protein
MRSLVYTVLLLSVTAPAIAGESKAAPPPTYRMNVVYIFETQNTASAPESIMVIGNSGFRSLAALRRFVASLPRGAVLEWAPGCEQLGGELLLSSAKDMEEFRVLCKDRGIAFILHPWG